MQKTGNGLLRWIAVFKFLKAISLVLLGLGALKLIHTDPNGVLTQWAMRLGLDPGGRYVDRAIEKAASLPPRKFEELGLGSFAYAALFLVEGTGLWLRKRWGEWVTVIITGSLVPVEVYELTRHPTAGKMVLLVLNLAVVMYLVWRIRHEDKDQRGAGVDGARPIEG
jgi:uncharacterized membrane protein (DUF2068 family)